MSTMKRRGLSILAYLASLFDHVLQVVPSVCVEDLADDLAGLRIAGDAPRNDCAKLDEKGVPRLV